MPTRNQIILLVEDERRDEVLIRRVFDKHGLGNEIVVARDGVEALDYLHGTGTHLGRDPLEIPVLVLLDLKLPRIDGLTVLQRIRADERTSLMPVVILTSSDEDRDRLSGYRLGANSYVNKPVEFEAFSEAVRQVGLYWLVVNRPPPLPDGGRHP